MEAYKEIDPQFISMKGKIDANENKIIQMTSIINNYLKAVRGIIYIICRNAIHPVENDG